MLDRIRSNLLRQLFLYWDEKRGHRRAPSRDDIDPGEIVGVLPNVYLIDVEEEPCRYRVRRWFWANSVTRPPLGFKGLARPFDFLGNIGWGRSVSQSTFPHLVFVR